MKKIVVLYFLLIAFSAMAQNPKPFVVPELRAWSGTSGSFLVSSKTAVVFNKKTKDIAHTFVADYQTMFGKYLKLKKSTASDHAIFFVINSEVLNDKGDEAYRIEIDKNVMVTANSAVELYLATRTLLQMLEQSSQLPCGVINDYPEYPMLVLFAQMDNEKEWVQQFHYGVIRNNNTRLMTQVGADAGCDSIATVSTAKSLAKFLNRLDVEEKLTKTIIYNLNPAENEMLTTMLGNFQSGSVAGKMQFGAAWWFLDQKTGMENQMNTLSVLGLLSRFVGMLTDSRSFVSYPRHEYFHRTLCNLLGNDVENGLLPHEELEFIGQMVENICYYNAKHFFDF